MIEIVFSKPIRVNKKFRANNKDLDVSSRDLNLIVDKVLYHSLLSSENRKKLKHSEKRKVPGISPPGALLQFRAGMQRFICNCTACAISPCISSTEVIIAEYLKMSIQYLNDFLKIKITTATFFR